MNTLLLIFCFITFFGVSYSVDDWWTHAQLYQIYPRSYKDSNGDGIGDLKGIREKIRHLADIGVTATWISPIFVSPMKDFGYDIADFYNIADEYGTKQDLIDLIKEANALGIRVLLDYVPNHTSDQCEWFKKSVRREGKYENYYIWHPGKVTLNDTRIPPSNWVSVFRGSMWTFNEERNEYYLHQFLPEQPDLNYRNPDVVEEMNNVMKYWLGIGASGFRVDAIPHLVEVDMDEDLLYPDEPLSGNTDDPDDYNYLDHIYTRERNETWDIVYGWRQVTDEFARINGSETKILLMEAMSATEIVMQYYGNATHEGAHFPFNFQLTFLNKDHNAKSIVNSINHWFENMPTGRVANWVAGNHDQKRITGRYGPERADGIIMLTMLLPGVSVTYQGEEIGMLNHYLSFEDTLDPQACNSGIELYNFTSRDPERTPFHWDDSDNAGFSTGNKTWLPIPDNYKEINLKNQKDAEKSTYKMYKALSELRRENVIMNGSFAIKVLNDDLLAFTRTYQSETIIVLHSTSESDLRTDLHSFFEGLKERVVVEISSVQSPRHKGDLLPTDNILVLPYESLVLRNTATITRISFVMSLVICLLVLIFRRSIE